MSPERDRALEAFNSLKEKLRTVSQEPESHPELTSRPFDVRTKKHHYIPKHFVDGFLDEDGLAWRYDKKTDRIVQNRTGSKGVFFECDRNSVDLNDGIAMPIFEHYYTVMDNLFPIAIKLLRRPGYLSPELALELYEHLNIFLIDLYWRNINTDSRFNRIFDASSKHLASVLTGPFGTIDHSVAKQLPGYKQLARIHIVQETMRSAKEYIDSKNKMLNGLGTLASSHLCLGDSPYLFKREPIEHIDLITIPIILPLSSNRFYLRNFKPGLPWEPLKTTLLNALIIAQSTKMVVCRDRDTLELAIRTYRSAKETGSLNTIKSMIFGDH